MLPLISVVTPSYNQSQFLEETIRAVLNQDYPRIEYLVMDGGSTDGSVDIIHKYADRLAYWVSEPDGGQAQAINRGFARATGDVLTWINSDDLLLPGALAAAAKAYQANPQAMLFADTVYFSPADDLAYVLRQHNITLANMVAYWRKDWAWNQPGNFVPRSVWERIGPLDERLRYVFDRDWMCRLLSTNTPLVYLEEPLAAFRLHAGSKSVGEASHWGREQLVITERYAAALPSYRAPELYAWQSLMDATMRTSLLFIGSWNARVALQHLLRAIRLWPRVLILPHFWKLLGRALCPRPVVPLVRRLWLLARRQHRLALSGITGRSYGG